MSNEQVRIMTVKNGYIVSPDSFEAGMGGRYDNSYVYPTREALSKGVAEFMAQPINSKGR
jgi:hypothetical protein